MKKLLIRLALCAFLFPSAIILSLQAATAEPGVVSREKLVPFGQLAWSVPEFEMPTASPGLPLLNIVDNSPEAILLRRLEQQGKAAGFKNVIYDNHDRGHSLPAPDMFPSLSKLYFSDELKKLKLDFGLAGKIILPAIVIGNSSTAITKGQRRRSQARLSMTAPNGPNRAHLTYVTNHLYIYPEHRDHDNTDLFPANWPYMVITQGSSYSDKPFMRAILMTVAAFTPETQARLQKLNLIAPTLQMILRRSQKAVYTRAAYMSGAAHPTVFGKRRLVPERMVAMAAALRADQVPPMVHLSVQEDEFDTKAGLAGLSEILFDTPSSIARIWRTTDYSRRMVVSAESTVDPNGHPLTFSWSVLRGDPKRVRITPIGENGASAEISVDWHDTRKITPTHKRLTNRVDIGVFAWNGFHDSAPAIISISFPAHQKRVYDVDPEGNGARLISVDYDAAERKASYDPVLHWSAPWTDEYVYDDAKGLIAIKRQSGDETITLSTPDELADGQPVIYEMEETEKARFLSMTSDVSQ